MSEARDPLVVLVTAPPDRAHEIARVLVESGHAACVNLVPGLRSLYRYKGDLHDEPESLLVIKTQRAHLAALEALVAEVHPYELPEFLVLPVAGGSAAYLTWLGEALAPEAED